MKQMIEIEDIFSSSVKVLFNRLSTTDGLAEWFADSVKQDKNTFTFKWKDSEQSAELLEIEQNVKIRFQWKDSRDNEYFEFQINTDPLTGDIALLIIDFTDEDDEDDVVGLWEKQLDKLHRILGA